MLLNTWRQSIFMFNLKFLTISKTLFSFSKWNCFIPISPNEKEFALVSTISISMSTSSKTTVYLSNLKIKKEIITVKTKLPKDCWLMHILIQLITQRVFWDFAAQEIFFA